MSLEKFGDREIHTIFIGGIWASGRPSVARTILGSCIAVCLRDPKFGIGGMNHFMLPSGDPDAGRHSRYGVHAMELLINRCMQEGADRRRLEAKVFGGGHVLSTTESAQSVPKINIEFALQFLEIEGIPIVSRDLGGRSGREVMFCTDTGKVLMRRLRECPVTVPVLPREPVPTVPDSDDNVTLF